jgi:hypothetical protein
MTTLPGPVELKSIGYRLADFLPKDLRDFLATAVWRIFQPLVQHGVQHTLLIDLTIFRVLKM